MTTRVYVRRSAKCGKSNREKIRTGFSAPALARWSSVRSPRQTTSTSSQNTLVFSGISCEVQRKKYERQTWCSQGRAPGHAQCAATLRTSSCTRSTPRGPSSYRQDLSRRGRKGTSYLRDHRALSFAVNSLFAHSSRQLCKVRRARR